MRRKRKLTKLDKVQVILEEAKRFVNETQYELTTGYSLADGEPVDDNGYVWETISCFGRHILYQGLIWVFDLCDHRSMVDHSDLSDAENGSFDMECLDCGQSFHGYW